MQILMAICKKNIFYNFYKNFQLHKIVTINKSISN